MLGNHDKPRIASRVGDAQAKVAAMLLLTLRGMPTLYYGDEIGMRQIKIPPHRVRDPYELNVPGLGLGRDGCRTPMQWDASDKAGFSDGDPWLPLGEDHRQLNVENQRADRTLDLHAAPTADRPAPRPSGAGDRRLPADGRDRRPAALRARAGRERLVVALNLGTEPVEVDFAPGDVRGRLVLSTHGDRDGEQVADALALRDNEGVVVELTVIPSTARDLS